jgi:hypothetical protein
VLVPDEADRRLAAVSLVRLENGDLAIFYLKELDDDDCRPYCRVSADDGASWGKPVALARSRSYYRMHSGRATRLATGRLLVPVTKQANARDDSRKGSLLTLLSDDNGRTWRASRIPVAAPQGDFDLGDPGVVELGDRTLLAWFRTSEGVQYTSRSQDGGLNWSAAGSSSIVSPNHPAALRRDAASGHLLLIWNAHTDPAAARRGPATPLAAAVSSDGGVTWSPPRPIEHDVYGSFSHPTFAIIGGRILAAYRTTADDSQQSRPGFVSSQVATVELGWLPAPMEADK